MRLCQPPDGNTSPKYKLLCFITTNFFCKEKNAQAFNRDRCCHLLLCLRSIPFHFNDRFNFLFCFTNISAKIFSAFLLLRPATYCAHFSQMLFPLKNEGKSATSFCHQVAALFLDMFYNLYLLKNHKIAKNSTTATTTEKISTYLESLEF
jgi:hypothetical protein